VPRDSCGRTKAVEVEEAVHGSPVAAVAVVGTVRSPGPTKAAVAAVVAVAFELEAVPLGTQVAR
jgi:hypothetical protein